MRYADDLIAVCKSRQQAEAALVRITDLLAELGLQPKAAKTRIVHLEVGGGGLDFLGFHHRLVLHHGASRIEVAQMRGHADHDEHPAGHEGNGQDLQVGQAFGAEERMGHGGVPA